MGSFWEQFETNRKIENEKQIINKDLIKLIFNSDYLIIISPTTYQPSSVLPSLAMGTIRSGEL